ncbi:hypothetical protein NEUTE1DRAFT_39400 [Neurospora tetrasperma FGSC 2508]|uniref:Uncharacterized protein n=1 Tax=Neurospora tetrasperma (strain FGSC 2508 / ATCC MYA-4615 / P0657) TaxID=510951 RepID=F8MGR0_NEUT8|nr:uncharacterized protein NEUTE1DRAFT_39400 [Neurospora tetrasperma FGSC 2508]EGO59479.1 hypothetical protein NEUTE1DRAFT_39400 [Neurospora tetrasperma FGSC 2508]EGZ73604.1 hypothetical protein NEUTE2DRAFT_62859 [Neurospora tetrasperma FGSC 2509]
MVDPGHFPKCLELSVYARGACSVMTPLRHPVHDGESRSLQCSSMMILPPSSDLDMQRKKKSHSRLSYGLALYAFPFVEGR